MHRRKEKGCQPHSQRLKAETSIPSTMCERALVLNRTDYLYYKHAYYIHTNTHRKREKEREREREQERDEKRRKRESTNTMKIDTIHRSHLSYYTQTRMHCEFDIRLDVHANAWSQYDK